MATSLQLPNVEGKLNSKHNNTLSKPIANFLNRFVDVYKSLENNEKTLSISCPNAFGQSNISTMATWIRWINQRTSWKPKTAVVPNENRSWSLF